LIELLVVISIIAILASLIFPALGRARRKAEQIKCMSNLKQVGLGIQMYVDEHDDRLPGPVLTGSMANYDRNASWQVVYHLAPYIGAPTPSARMVVAEAFVCPAYVRHYAGEGIMGRKMWILNDNLDPRAAERILPFGYPLAPLQSNPIKLSSISQYGDPSGIWAMSDVDYIHPSINTATTWRDEIPERPVHGPVRNELYFDHHVESVRW